MSNITFNESSGLQDSIFGKSQEPIKLFLKKRGEAFEQQSMIKELFTMESSVHAMEKFTSMTAMNGFEPVGESGNYPLDGMRESFKKVIEHVTWKNSFAISHEIIADAMLMDLKQRPEQFIAGYHRTRENFAASLFGAAIQGKTIANFRATGGGSLTDGGRQGVNSFDVTGADGQPVFSKAHPSILDKKQTQSNVFSDAFSNDALMAMESKMQDFRGDNDEILDVAPTTIIIPNDYELKRDVFAAIGADKDPNTANNGFNYTFGRWNVIVWQYLNLYLGTDKKPWILLDKRYNETYKCAVWMDREPLTIRSELADNDDNVWKGIARFGVGFNDWRGFAVGGVSGGTALIPA